VAHPLLRDARTAALFFVIAIVLLALYPIDRKAYEEIRAKIDRRESKAAAGTP
jgi:Na+/melibiose symporter-like transporter